MIEIVEVKTLRDLKKFVKFPYTLFTNNSHWIPPLLFDEFKTLRKDRNPAFEHCEANYWLAYKDGKIAGRIAAIINNRYVEKWNNKNARFGWIDFIDDEEVSGALLKQAEHWALEKGMNGIHGPLGFCDLDREGMLVEGYEEDSLLITNYNHPYYPAHMMKHGYTKDTDWLEFEIKVPEEVPEKLERINNVVIKRLNLTIVREDSSKKLLKHATGVFNLLNDAYKELYGVVPLSEAQIAAYVKQYFGFINPDYVRVIYDENNVMAGFGIAIPSLSNAMKKSQGRIFPFGFIHILKAMKKNDRLDLYLVAIRPDLQGKGINALILADFTKTAYQNGIRFAETGPELEDNKNVQSLWKYFETRQHKRRRCFIKKMKESQTESLA